MPKVSVVVPSYNYASLLPSALDSVLAQTFQDWELVIVDDGSTDDSVSVIRSYLRDHPDRIRFFQHEDRKNKGLNSTYQLAFEKCRGEYVALLEADDHWREDSLALRVEVLNSRSEVAVVYTDVEMFGEPKPMKKIKADIRKWELPYEKIARRPFYAFGYLMEKNLVLTCSAFMTRKKFLEGLDFKVPYDAWFDWWILFQLSLLGEFCWIPEKATFWKIGSASYLHAFNRKIDLYRESRKFAGHLFNLMWTRFNRGKHQDKERLKIRLHKELKKREWSRQIARIEIISRIPVHRMLMMLTDVWAFIKRLIKKVIGSQLYQRFKRKFYRRMVFRR